MHKVTLIVAGIVAGAVLCATAITTGSLAVAPARAAGSSTYRQLAIFGEVFEKVERHYVTPPDKGRLIEKAVNGMLSSLDPHSSYMNAKDAEAAQAQITGEFGGLGIQVTIENDLVKVISPIDNTPAARAGIMAGDYISEIDDRSVKGLKLEEAVGKMRGPVHTPVKLTLIRKDAEGPIERTLMRDTIAVEAVKHRLESDIGYIRVMSFTGKTYDGLETAIAKLKTALPADELKGYVLDLRLNPGGLVDQAIKVSDAFLERGEIVSTRGRDEIRRYSAGAGDATDHKPLIVLIDGGSASASEIVAGALQDLRRATILGTRSFGKGSVQTIIPMGKAGSLRLTTALYFTPSGTSIQGTGITPDITVEQSLPPNLKGKLQTPSESRLPGHIRGQSETDTGSGSAAYIPLEAKEDAQLQYALELLRGHKHDASFPPEQKPARPGGANLQ